MHNVIYHHYIFFGEVSRYFANFLIAFLFSSHWILEVLCILDISLLWYATCKYFLLITDFSFYSLNSVLHRTDLILLMSNLSVFLSWSKLLVFYLKTHLQTQSHIDIAPIFSSRSCIVLYFIFRSIIHFA